MKEKYYIYKKDDGSNGTIAKFSNGLFYKYESGKWIETPELIKIFFEITNYEEIDEKELEKAIRGESKK